MSNLRKRSQARALALQAMCAFEALGDAFQSRLPEFLRDPETHADLGFEEAPAEESLHFAQRLAQDAWRRREVIDAQIDGGAAHWSLSRMTPVDRNILRLGLHELFDDSGTPPQVVINEAVDLAHLFGDQDSPAFVNGVLDGLWRARQGETTLRSDDGAV